MLIADSERGGVTVDLMKIPAISVMHCAFLRGRYGPDLYMSILVRHFLVILDSWLFIWVGSIPLDEEGPSPCPVMGVFE